MLPASHSARGARALLPCRIRLAYRRPRPALLCLLPRASSPHDRFIHLNLRRFLRGKEPHGLVFHAFSAAQQAVARYALSLISQYTLLTFSQVLESNTYHAMIRFADSGVPDTSWTYYPEAIKEGGDVWVGNTAYVVPTKGSYASRRSCIFSAALSPTKLPRASQIRPI